MGILSALFAAVSGLNANGTNLSIIGNNIANTGTVGFKSSCANFASTDGSMPIDDRERLTRLLNKKIRFIDDPLYHQPDAQSAIETVVQK